MNIWKRLREFFRFTRPQYILQEQIGNGRIKYVIYGKIAVLDYIELSRYDSLDAAEVKFEELCKAYKLSKIKEKKTSKIILRSKF